jgi:hypothetical protein
MPDQVERFKPIVAASKVQGFGAGMEKAPIAGRWVRYSDYEKLEQQRCEERDALLERVERGQKAEAERDKEAALREDAYRYQQAAEDLLNPEQKRVARAELERDQARKQVLEEVREKAALLQRWARTKRREAKDVSGPTEKLKLEWVAKGYDGAADLVLAALDHPDQSKGREQ